MVIFNTFPSEHLWRVFCPQTLQGAAKGRNEMDAFQKEMESLRGREEGADHPWGVNEL